MKSYSHPMSRSYTTSLKKPSLWLAKTWFCGCLMSCLGTGGMLVHAWQSQSTVRTAVVQTEEPKRVEVVEAAQISEAAVLLATLRQSGSNSAPQTHRSNLENKDSDSLTVWFDSAQR